MSKSHPLPKIPTTMNEQLKSAVLAKCGEVTKVSKYASSNELDWDLEKVADGFDIEAWGGCVKLSFSEKDDFSSPVWPLAAKILGIEQSQNRLVVNQNPPLPAEKPDFETVGNEPWFTTNLPSLADVDAASRETFSRSDNRHAFDTGARWVLDSIKGAVRPSDELLRQAFSLGFTCHLYPLKEAHDEFAKWLKTLPADPLQADREIVRGSIEIHKTTGSNMLCFQNDSKTYQALKRLAGLGVGNG
jgi:hypothetical protein